MTFTHALVGLISEKHLLKHPFYQAWTAGELKLSDLNAYSRQYFHHVEAFPRYLSATHAGCESPKARKSLVRNLMDEEGGEKSHPELWLQFAQAAGASEAEVRGEELLPETRSLIDTFNRLARSSYAEGLGALFAYESQVPEVAQSKIDGLERHYDHFGMSDAQALEFFTVHVKADIYHTREISELLEELTPAEKEKAQAATREASQALWGFLDGVSRLTGVTCAKLH